MANLTGKKVSETYAGLLKTSDNEAITSTPKEITDGLGNVTGVFISDEGLTGAGTSTNDFTDAFKTLLTKLGFTDVQILRMMNATADPTPIATSYEIQQADDGKTFNTTANGVEYTIASLTGDCSFIVNNDAGVTSEITTASETFDVEDGELGLITNMDSTLKVNV